MTLTKTEYSKTTPDAGLCLPDWRYLAGLWDGEGCVTISNQTSKINKTGEAYCTWMLRLNITNTSERLISSIHSEFGGRVWVGKLRDNAHKPQFQWCVFNAPDCLRILENILPHLRYKDEEAIIAMEYFRYIVDRSNGPRRRKRLTREDENIRSGIVERLRLVSGRKRRESYKPFKGRSQR